jgi:hypothetical protein
MNIQTGIRRNIIRALTALTLVPVLVLMVVLITPPESMNAG